MTQNTNERGQQAVADDILSNNDNSVNTDLDSTVKVDDSFQDNSDNSTNIETDVETEVETDVEVEDSFNDYSVENEAEDSFNDNSVETEVELEVEIEDSFNDNSDNSINTEIETEIEDSYNAEWDSSVRNQDSFNITSSFNTQTLNDNSTTIGVRQSNAGCGDLNLGGLFGVAGAAKSGHGGSGGGDGGRRRAQHDHGVAAPLQLATDRQEAVGVADHARGDVHDRTGPGAAHGTEHTDR